MRPIAPPQDARLLAQHDELRRELNHRQAHIARAIVRSLIRAMTSSVCWVRLDAIRSAADLR